MSLVEHRNVDRIIERKQLSMKINEDKASAGPQSVSCLPAKQSALWEHILFLLFPDTECLLSHNVQQC